MKVVLGTVIFCLFGAVAMGQTVFTVPMDGAQANAGAGTGSTFVGSGTITLNAAEDQITVSLTHDIPNGNVTQGHIHEAPAGVNGGIVFGFVDGQSPINEVFAISPAQVTTLKANGYYVNIHTVAFGGGEIRGQILAPAVTGLPVSVWWTVAVVTLLVAASGMFAVRRLRPQTARVSR